MRTPSLAERTFAGLRQVVTYRFSEHSGHQSFGCNVFWAFTHELDDAPPYAGFGKYGRSVSGGCTPLVETFDIRSEQVVLKQFMALLKSDLPLLESLNSIERIIENVERYPTSAAQFLGAPVAESFNHAFCLEQVGRNAEAEALYRTTANDVAPGTTELAMMFQIAAQQRADDLKAKPSAVHSRGKSSGRRSVSASDSGTNYPVDKADTLESRLARKMRPLGIHPSYVLPRDVMQAIEQGNEPSMISWVDVNAEKLADELQRCGHDYSEHDSEFRAYLVNEIQTRQFDDYCARWLLTLPEDAIPVASADIYEMLEEHLVKSRETVHLHYLELDGVKAVPHIMQLVTRLRACLA